jgi:hypothetical protein
VCWAPSGPVTVARPAFSSTATTVPRVCLPSRVKRTVEPTLVFVLGMADGNALRVPTPRLCPFDGLRAMTARDWRPLGPVDSSQVGTLDLG